MIRSGFRFVVTSIVRRAGQHQASGFVRVVDGATGDVLFVAPAFESDHRTRDSNPRGGARGARGIAVFDDQLVIANTDLLLILDRDWRVQDQVSNPLLGGIHDILAEHDGIWVTSANADLLVKVSRNGRVLEDWEWRSDEQVARHVALPAVPLVDRTLDYRAPDVLHTGVRNIVHLNSVNHGPNGLLVSFGRILPRAAYYRRRLAGAAGGAAARLGLNSVTPRAGNSRPRSIPASRIPGCSSMVLSLDPLHRARVVRREEGIDVPNHNVLWWRGRLVYCDTNRNRVVVSQPGGHGCETSVHLAVSPGFLRGLAQVDERTFLVGNQAPAAAYRVDLEAGKVVRCYDLGGEENESVYGVSLLPEDFSTPTKAPWLTD